MRDDTMDLHKRRRTMPCAGEGGKRHTEGARGAGVLSTAAGRKEENKPRARFDHHLDSALDTPPLTPFPIFGGVTGVEHGTIIMRLP